MTDQVRPLSIKEAAALRGALQTMSSDGAEVLAQQIPAAMVTNDEVPTFLYLSVGGRAARSTLQNGPIPGACYILDENNETVGEILVWVTDGYLSGLELAWFGEGSPAWPSPDRLTRNS